ncbi:MAG: response regulator transcription factor [Flavobacteriales bacterium]|nr:response regulator transcription factor [Flavobacteriales bacterium]
MPIGVMLFDDNRHIRDSLSLMLVADSRFKLCGAFEDASNAVELVSVLKPDVVLMDIDMPAKNGIEAVGEVHVAFHDLPIIMLTVFDDSDRVFQSLRKGAVGYLLKSTPPEKLIEALMEVKDGGAPMSPSVARKVMQHFQHDQLPEKADYKLSPREKDVLCLLVDGLSYKMIADRLDIGYETVRSHIKNIYVKLHVQTMTEAVAKTLKEGLV